MSLSSISLAALLTEVVLEIDLTRISPFMAGGADLMNRMFFGREGELKNIAESITKTSVAITCGRRMGKTTVLNRLARVVLPAHGQTCFFLNCQPVHDYHELRTEMATVWKRPDLPFDPEQPNSFAQVVAALTSPNGAPPIFLLDEVDELLRFDSQHQQRLFKQLRALSLDGRARFVMTGERSVQAHLHDANSPLFNFFGLNVRLSFLASASVNKLVVEPLSDMQIELHDPPRCSTRFRQRLPGIPIWCSGSARAWFRRSAGKGDELLSPRTSRQCSTIAPTSRITSRRFGGRPRCWPGLSRC
jgi:hypothetical protein